MIERQQLIQFIDDCLLPENFKDYCPNGLQIEGRSQISKIVTGVTVNSSLIAQAIATQADAIIVHHGLFWVGQNQAITGLIYQKIKPLIEHQINLIAYHLPLDAHPKLGNNAQLGALLGCKDIRFLDVDRQPGLFAVGKLSQPQPLKALVEHIQAKLKRTPQVFGDNAEPIDRVAWCTGGAHRYLPMAIEQGAQAFITGEYSLAMAELAIEAHVPLICAGHHATERGGVLALGEHIAKKLKVEVNFADTEQPA